MPDDAAAEFRRLRARTEASLPEFIGLRVEEAAELAQRLRLDFRVIRIYEDEWHTSDDRSNRVTVEVEDGVVTGARAALGLVYCTVAASRACSYVVHLYLVRHAGVERHRAGLAGAAVVPRGCLVGGHRAAFLMSPGRPAR
jgi:hypothetical protein